MPDNITMSKKEADRISIFEKLKKKELKQRKAGELLGISVRQVRRILIRYKKDGASGITHALRGIPSNNRVDRVILEKAVTILKRNYPDFSITLAHEKLVEFHRFPYSDERLRKELIEDVNNSIKLCIVIV